jgi:hypothetical protein
MLLFNFLDSHFNRSIDSPIERGAHHSTDLPIVLTGIASQ